MMIAATVHLRSSRSKEGSIITFGAYLKETGVMDDALEKELNDQVMAIVNEATDYARVLPMLMQKVHCNMFMQRIKGE